MRTYKKHFSDSGSALIATLILTALSMLILTASLGYVSSSFKNDKASSKQQFEVRHVESNLYESLNWLQTHARAITPFFSEENFYTYFERVPRTAATNDTSVFTVPSSIRLRNTTHAAMLISNPILGTSAFPQQADGGQSLSALFAASHFQDALVRITLVNAVPVDPSKDFGDPEAGNSPPRTNFLPVFRVDSMHGLFEGPHVYGFVTGDFAEKSIGFIGKDFVHMGRNCDAYFSDEGAYSLDTRVARCSVASSNDIGIATSKSIFGSISTPGILQQGSKWNGTVCSTFDRDCPIPGPTCIGVNCSAPETPTLESWKTLCPDSQGTLQINKNTTLSIVEDTPKERCWNKIVVQKNKTLTLASSNAAYHVNQLQLAKNATVVIDPLQKGAGVTLVTTQISQHALDSSSWNYANIKPYQFQLHYHGTGTLKVSGNKTHSLRIIAPLARVRVESTADFHGSIVARGLDVTEHASALHFDRSNAKKQSEAMIFSMKSFAVYRREYYE